MLAGVAEQRRVLVDVETGQKRVSHLRITPQRLATGPRFVRFPFTKAAGSLNHQSTTHSTGIDSHVLSV